MKKNLMVTLCLLLSVIFGLKAQITFEKTYGTLGDNFANDVYATSDGGYIIVGTGNFSGGVGDIFLLKTGSVGDTLWTRFIGGAGLDQGNAVVSTSDGGYIIAGSTTSFGAGASDAYLVKTDGNGNVLWSKTYGTSSNDVAYGVVQTSDGGYVFAGMEKQSGLNGSAHLVKVDATGNVLWSKTFGSNLRKNFAYTLEKTSDRGFIIGGWENLNLGINDDFCLIKADSNGNKLWYKSYGDVGHDQNFSVSSTSDGGYIMAGYTFSSTTFDVNVVKADADGNLLWSKNLGGSGADYAYAITETSDGGFALCGSSMSFGTGNIGYLAKLDVNGNLLWSKTMNGVDGDAFYSIRQTSDGGLILAGVKGESYGVTGSLYLVKTDADGNSGCNNSVTSSVYAPSILVGTPVANGTSTQTVTAATPSHTSGTSVTVICTSCTPVTWCLDADADGYGDPSVTQLSCTKPTGYVADNSDCNDADANIHPAAADVCNGIDDDCNDVIDDNAITAIITPPGSITLCSGNPLTLLANSGDNISYQWMKNGNNIAGATTSTLLIKKSGKYSVTESNTFGCSSTSPVTKVSLLPTPPATITPLGNLDICQTGFVDLQANSGPYLYQWTKGANIIAGATNEIYSATKTGTYKVIVTADNSCKKTSMPVKVTKSCREETALSQDNSNLSCYPNPSNGTFSIHLAMNDVTSGHAFIQIKNELNQVEYSIVVPIANGELKTMITGATLKDGLYWVQVIIGDQILQSRLMIQQ